MGDRRLGRVFKRGGVWWIRYYQRGMTRDERGRHIRESSRSRDRRAAAKLLARGSPRWPRAGRSPWTTSE